MPSRSPNQARDVGLVRGEQEVEGEQAAHRQRRPCLQQWEDGYCWYWAEPGLPISSGYPVQPCQRPPACGCASALVRGRRPGLTCTSKMVYSAEPL